MDSAWTSLTGRYSPELINFVGLGVVGYLSFWIPALLFLYVDMTKRPMWLYERKLQKTPGITWEEVRECVKVVLRNQLLVSMISVVFYLRVRAGQRSFPYAWQGLPSLFHVARDLTACVIIRDVLFYYGHVGLHTRYLYKTIHKQHHTFTAPVGMAAVYAHPVEHIVSNFIPVIAGPILLGSHILVVWMFVAMESIAAVCTHSGYYLPGVLHEASRFHDYHHECFRG